MEEKDNLSKTFEKLVESASSFDKEAFERVYQEYVALIFRFFFLRLRNQALAEDLCQAVFLKAWEKIHLLREREKILAWLFKIAHHLLVDYFRQKKEVSVADFSYLEKEGSLSLEDDLDLRNLLKDVWEVLDSLSEEQRQVIILRFFEGLTLPEIEEIMGKSNTAIRSLQYRALINLKKALVFRNENKNKKR